MLRAGRSGCDSGLGETTEYVQQKHRRLGSYPMGLPVSQADYPCSVADPQSLLTSRVLTVAAGVEQKYLQLNYTTN